MKISSNFEPPQLQSDGYQSGYSHKIWVEYNFLGENQASETFFLNFLGVLYRLYALGPQKLMWTKFFEFEFFFVRKKIKLSPHHPHT